MIIIKDIKKWMAILYISEEEYRNSKDYSKYSPNFASSPPFVMYNYIHKPKVHCVDGFIISIQGHEGTYSNPRGISKIYETMEIGFPNQKDKIMVDSDVRGYVPIQELQDMINRHGGIDATKSILDVWKYKTSSLKKYLRELKLENILEIPKSS